MAEIEPVSCWLIQSGWEEKKKGGGGLSCNSASVFVNIALNGIGGHRFPEKTGAAKSCE